MVDLPDDLPDDLTPAPADGQFANRQPDQIVFRASNPDNQVLLTITADGRMLIGPGLSMDDATQQAAAMLATHFQRAMGTPDTPASADE